MSASNPNCDTPIRVLGGPTLLIEYAGLRLLTDPTFDEPGEYPTPVPGLTLVKTERSSMTPAEVGAIDVVLLSHDEHDDNLDRSGREFLKTVALTVTTPSGARRLGGTARGLQFWKSVTVASPAGFDVIVTAMPALHGPEGSEAVAGDCIGFLVTADGHPSIYVSGDNASMRYVSQIAERYAPIDTAVLFIGGVRHKPVFDGALVTIDNDLATEAAKLLGARRVIPAHIEGWRHFNGTRSDVNAAFERAGLWD
jgi:L-ascorbate metabolism protein UlaG (beta-lactamase superfamily)